MSNFDKMIKLIEEKDIKGMEEWLKETQLLFELEDFFYPKFLSYCTEIKDVGSHKGKYFMDGV